MAHLLGTPSIEKEKETPTIQVELLPNHMHLMNWENGQKD